MDLSTELAQRCLQVKRAAIEDPNRDEFEDLASRERVARGQAARYGDIARGRAREEAEKTPAETFTGRLYPVPHTLGEAAWRLPAIAGGGALGYNAVSSNELPGVEELRKMVAPGKMEPTTIALSDFGQRMHDRLKALGHPSPVDLAQRMEKGLLANPRILPDILGSAQPDKAKALKQLVALTRSSAAGSDHKDVARRVVEEARSAFSGGAGKKGAPPKDPAAFFRGLLAPGTKKIEGPAKETLGEFGQALETALRVKGHEDPARAAGIIQRVMGNEPEKIKAALGMLPSSLGGKALTTETGAMRQRILAALGSKKVDPSVIREVMHDVAAAGKHGLGEGLSKWKRYGGAGAGAAIAALATGVPLGLRALWQRRQGGEAAVRAKAQMQEELSKAEEAAKQREAILARMGT